MRKRASLAFSLSKFPIARSTGCLPGAKRWFSSGSSEGFLQGNATNYVEAMYESWKENPSSVHKSWQASLCRDGDSVNMFV